MHVTIRRHVKDVSVCVRRFGLDTLVRSPYLPTASSYVTGRLSTQMRPPYLQSTRCIIRWRSGVSINNSHCTPTAPVSSNVGSGRFVVRTRLCKVLSKGIAKELVAETTFRRLDASELPKEVYHGIRFADGLQ